MSESMQKNAMGIILECKAFSSSISPVLERAEKIISDISGEG